MKIPPYWAKETYEGEDGKGRGRFATGLGWSFESFEKAKTEARERARRVFELIVNGEKPGMYGYLDRPIREEIVETISQDGEEVAVITRNSYGALVLNTALVMFADIDFPALRWRGVWDALVMMFSRKKRRERRKEIEDERLDWVGRWVQGNRDHPVRVYRTANGLRLLFTGRLYEPTSEETMGMLGELETDPLYLQLTCNQECFRARLTPKPWRCGCDRPPTGYPWADEEGEREYRRWQQQYDEKTAGIPVCDLVEEYGSLAENAVIRQIVEIHDQYVCVSSEGRLG